jgi:hypothetical protein
MYVSGQVQVFQRDMMPSFFSALKMEAAHSSRLQVPVYEGVGVASSKKVLL